MPRTTTKKDGAIPQIRCDKRLEDETRECASKSMMDLSEYVRAALREMNQKTNAK